jgi:diguanylate cyclase (GGDEF)-like protein
MTATALTARAAERPPRLVVRVAVFTALVLALAAAAIALLVRSGGTAQAQRYAIERARFATEAVLARELRATDLARPMPARRRRELDRIFRDSVLLEGIVGVSLYDAAGRLRYETGRSATRRLARQLAAEALGGVAVSTVTRPRPGADRELLTYLPVALGGTTGIAVVEQDYGPIQAAGRRSAWLAAAVLEGLLLLLLVVLVPVLVGVTRRIRRQIAEIEHAASHDEQTGTTNRIRLRRAVEEALASAAPGALLVVDIDGFSELNEIFGSDGADAVLKEVALRLRWELSDCELVARLGEDEFGILLDSASPDVITGVADRINTALAVPVVVDAVRVAVTVSMGAATLTEPGLDFVTTVRRAGAALCVAKEERDGAIHIYEPGHDEPETSRAALLAELRNGFEKGELLVHYQPQVDLTTRQVRGVEALLRWQHSTRGLLAAGEFVHEAERSGLAKELGRFVLENAGHCWGEWNALGLPLELSINLGAVDLLDASLPDDVADVLDLYGIPSWNVVLEITERTLVTDERRTYDVVGALRELGVRLAVDDFGAGYSSLASLQRFPVQVVKLDRSLLANASAEPAARAILNGSIELAHAIGATVVAEGVETREQWELVYALGCDIAQGYFVGYPLPPEEIPLLLQAVPAVTEAAAA